MTSATLTTRSMAHRSRNRTPLHQRIWNFMTAASTRRAGIELHRRALLRADSDPVKAELMAAVRSIENT